MREKKRRDRKAKWYLPEEDWLTMIERFMF